jgi:hypothetical protein
LSNKYFDLIKRKTKDSLFIVFEKPSEKEINYDSKTQQIIEMKDYYMYHNEKAITTIENKFLYSVTKFDEYMLHFTSEKKFEDIFASNASDIFNENDHDDLGNNLSENESYDDEDIIDDQDNINDSIKNLDQF